LCGVAYTQGHERFRLLLSDQPPLHKLKEDLIAAVESHFSAQEELKDIYDVFDNEEFSKEFGKLEQKHSQVSYEEFSASTPSCEPQ
jgi:hypothetical protein